MFFLFKFLESVFPFLVFALKRSWDNLNDDQQKAIVNSGLIGQYLKNNLNALSGDLVAAIAKATSLDPAVVSSTLLALAKKLGYTEYDEDRAVKFLQDKLSSAASNEQWNGLLLILLNAGGTILSGGTIDWLHLALGLGEFAYQKFVAPLLLDTVGTQTKAPVPDQPVESSPKSVTVTSDTPSGIVSNQQQPVTVDISQSPGSSLTT